MRRPVAIVGLGQLGSMFGIGLIRIGRPVLPILRGDPIEQLAAHDPELVLVAVGEKDLDATLDTIPSALRDRIALLQNELLPPDWRRHALEEPTVAVVWFEKKRARAPSIVRTTRIAGPHAELLVQALSASDIPARRIDSRDLSFELVRKNLYILGSNVAGLAVGGTTGDLVTTHRELAIAILRDAIAIDAARLGEALPEEALIECALGDFAKDPAHACLGRTAKDRRARAIARADALGLEIPAIRRIEAG